MYKAYQQIAEGLRIMAEGYELLANNEVSAKVQEPQVVKQAESKSKVQEQEKVENEPKAEETENVSETEEQKTENLTIEDVRALMREKNKQGKIDKCQALLKEYGVVRLSDIPSEKYEEFIKKVEVL